MALQTKTFSSSYSNGYHTELTLAEESIDTSSNTSKISYTLKLFAGGSYFTSYAVGHEVSLAGKVVSGAYRPNAPQYSIAQNGSITLASGSATVEHGSDGTLEMAVAFSISVYKTDYTPGDIAVTGKTMTLTAIARAATVGATDANIGSVSAVTISRRDAGYTASVQYSFGSLSGYLTADGGVSSSEIKLSAASIAWKIPESFYAEIPNAKSGVCTLTCKTYSGNTQIGSAQTASITVTASQSLCAPKVTGSVEDVNEETLALTGDSSRLVRFYSTARCTIFAEAVNGADITAKSVNGAAIEETTLDIANVETSVFAFSATDSRGYTTRVEKTAKLVRYRKLTNNATIERTDPTSGKAILTVRGEYFNGSFGAADNTLTLTYKIGYSGEEIEFMPTLTESGGYSAEVEVSGLTYSQSHTVTVAVSDALMRVEKKLTVKKGLPVFDWGESDFRFHVPVDIQGALTVDGAQAAGIVAEGTKGIWNYRKWSNGDAECWGTYSGTAAVTKNLSGAYYSEEITVDYPFEFAASPVCVVSGGSDSKINWARSFGVNAVGYAVFLVVALEEQSGAEISVNLHAFGKWKA